MATIRSIGGVVALAATLGVVAVAVPSSHAACSDPAMAEAVRAQIATQCVCSAVSNHGQYVKCVVHKVKEAVDNGLPTNCKGAVTRCAARSTCGKKAGFVTCCRAESGTCRDLLCQDHSTPCTLDSECP